MGIIDRKLLWLALSGTGAANLSGADALLDGEAQGLAFDFTDQSVRIIDTSTPSNSTRSTGIVNQGSLVGPSGKLTYTSPSNKLTRQSDGYYKYQAHNLIAYSEDLTNWSSGSLTSKTATTYTEDTATSWHGVYMSPTFISGGTYTIVADLSPGLREYATLSINTDADTAAYACARFYLSGTGSVTDTEANGTGYSVVSTSVEQISASVYRCTMIAVVGASAVRTIVASALDGTTVTPSGRGCQYYAGSPASSSLGVTRIHVYRYPANTDYIRTTTSGAKYALPLEYDTSGNCLGLLVEEARTNVLTYSQKLNSWTTIISATASDDSLTSVTGATDASQLIESTSGVSSHYASLNLTIGTGSVTYSVYAKLVAGTRYLQLRPGGIGSGKAFANYDLSNGIVVVGGTGGAELTSTSIEDVGNGWYRCVLVANHASAPTSFVLAFSNTTTELPTYSGVGSTHTIGIYGAQVEAGSFPTSPILTYGAAASRLVDDIKIATTAMPWSSTAMSSMAKWTQLHPSSGITSAIIGADGDYIIYTTGTAIRTYDGTSVASSGVAAADNTTFQAAASFENGVGQKITVNGETTQTASFDGTMGSGTSVWIGNRNVLTSAASKIISKILMVPRAKTTAELESDSTQ